nr:putative transcription elongation factor SPT5 homolog 1 [Tanacetum cinerariifolium]
MPRPRDDYEEDVEDEEHIDSIDEDDDEDYGTSRGSRSKCQRSDFIDDAAEEDEEEEDEDDDEDYRAGRGRRRGAKAAKNASSFFYEEAVVDDSEDDEEEEEVENGFIADERDEQEDVKDARRMHRRPRLITREEEQEDVEAFEREIQKRFARNQSEYNLMFKDGFLYKTVSIKSIGYQSIRPSFDELEKFREPNEDGDGDKASLSTLFANRKKGHFLKGDRVIIVKGDLKNLKGCVEKVEENTVHIKPNATDLPETIAVNERELCKYFEPGNHVKVVSGAHEGVTGMVITVDGHLLDNSNFGVIIRVDSEAVQVLKGVADRAEVQLVRLRDIKYKIDRKISAQDRYKNTVSTKDVVKVIDGPCKGRQGLVEHIYRGILVIYDRHHLKHARFICTKSQSCILVGSSANGDRNETIAVNERELCNYFEPGNHVKVVSGAQEGVTGMVIAVVGHLVNIVSDTTKEAVSDTYVYSLTMLLSSEVTSGISKVGDFELHDLVQLE